LLRQRSPSIFDFQRDFAVDRQTGEIHTLRPLESQPPVREVTLTVNDRGTPRRTAQTVVRINVRQNCPSAQVLVLPPLQCRDTYTVRIRDDANIGAEVATISAPVRISIDMKEKFKKKI
jgi:hypothetical protein